MSIIIFNSSLDDRYDKIPPELTSVQRILSPTLMKLIEALIQLISSKVNH